MEQSKINSQQLKAIATMCSIANIAKEDKEVMVQGFSGGRCTSSRDLYYAEASEMLKHLATLQWVDPAVTKMRNKIYYYAHEMNWVKKNKVGKTVADGERVDKWMLKSSYLKKKLNRYTYNELPKLVSQFEIVYKSFLNSF